MVLMRNKTSLFLNDDEGSSSFSPEMLDAFKMESAELLEKLEAQCTNIDLALQNGMEITSEDVGEIFRNLHTLKGLARMANITPLENCLHVVEEYFDQVRNGLKKMTDVGLQLLSDTQNVCESILKTFPKAADPATQQTIDKINQLIKGEAPAATAPTSAPAPTATPAAPVADSFDEEEALVTSAAQQLGNETSAAADLSPTALEMERFKKYIPRPEKLFATTFPAGKFAGTNALLQSEECDGVGKIGEVILARTIPDGSLILFSSDLEGEMVNSLFNINCTEIQKTVDGLSVLSEPWKTLKLEEGAHTEVAAQEPAPSTTEEAPIVDVVPSVSVSPDLGGIDIDPSLLADLESLPSTPKAAAPAAPSSAPVAPEAAAPVEIEDFDSQNQNASGESADLEPELLADFLTNAEELLEKLATSMLDLESDPTSKNAIEEIFRNAHTIKGTAGMFGFRAIEKLTHLMENIFDRVRKNELTVTPDLMDALLFGLDRVKAMFESLRKTESAEHKINDALAKLKNAVAGRPQTAAAPTAAPIPATQAAAPVGGSDDFAAIMAAAAAEEAARASAPATPPPASGSSGSSSQPPATSAPAAPAKTASGEEAKKADPAGGTIRVDLKRLDNLVNLVGELVIDRTRFSRIEEELRSHYGNSEVGHKLSESVLLFGRHMNEVQSLIMKIRMVPVGTVFTKFTRVVRDLSRQLNKDVTLEIEGGETELDKTLVDEIGDPLIHLIRNSVDHGIEMPDVREASGKSRRGVISLRAYQDGNMIVISVEDDGKGLATEKIREKAIKNGLIKETDQIPDSEIFNLIFEPGFSTAEKVTNVSGRGVGMDVVKKGIVKLKGVIELASRQGKGTTITIKLPLTLAILPSLMMEVKKECYAIPLVNVIESIRLDPKEIQTIGSSQFVKLREHVIPLINISQLFALNNLSEKMWYREKTEQPVKASRRDSQQKNQRIIFVVVGVGEKRFGLVVDQLLGQQEIVIRSIGNLMGKQSGIAGGCVLGNGTVSLVLDVGEIIEEYSVSTPETVTHVA